MSTDHSTNNDPSNKGGASDSDPSRLDALTSDMKNFKKGPADLKLSVATRDQYLATLATYRNSLHGERDKMNKLETLGNVGTLASAGQTKKNLQTDVTGVQGIQHSVTKYLEYLDEFERAIKAACDRLIQAG
jgi:hypothetical protein